MTSPAASGLPAVRVRDLEVVRSGHPVLRNISLDVPRGQIVGLLGPSGCGKTTLMRCIVGVQVIASGEVTVLGERAGSASLRPRIGYVTQAPAVYSDLSVTENLRYFATVAGVPARDLSARVAEVIEQVDLGRCRESEVAKLSGGQVSRVSLGAALVGRPELLVLDEPTVGLDPVLRVELWGLFAEIAREGATLLVSSHVMDEANRCDRLLLMRDGAIIADDSVAGILGSTGAQDVEGAFLHLVERSDPEGSRLDAGRVPRDR